MWKNNDILAELKELAPSLANLPKQSVFKVPNTYFEDNKYVWENLENEPNISVNKGNDFTLPQNYFADFPERLNKTIAALDTDESSLDKKYKATQNFKVPENYFEQFEANLMAKIEDEAAAPLLSELDLTNENAFKVPENYFEQLSDKVLAGIKAETSETVDAHSAKEAFSLPSGYFNNFEARLQERIAKEEKSEAKVIQLNPNRANESKEAPAPASESLVRKITRWGTAVAAVMALFVGINFWFGNNTENNTTAAFDLEAEFKKINKSAVREYVLYNEDEFEEDVIFAAKGYYDEGYKFYDRSKLNDIDPDILREYFEEDIL